MGEEKQLGEYLESDIALCVQNNQEEYLKRFRNLPKRKLNVAAGFFGGNWFAYRLMIKEGIFFWLLELLVIYGVVAICLIIKMRLGVDLELIKTLVVIEIMALAVFFFLLAGFFADEIYFKRIQQVLEKQGRKGAPEPAQGLQKDALKSGYGVSILCFILMGLAWGVIIQDIIRLWTIRLIIFLVG